MKQIMVFHDSAEYDKLKENTFSLFKACGFPSDKALQASENVKRIYVEYDKAQECFEQGNQKKEDFHYRNAYGLAEEMNKILKTRYDNRFLVDMVYNWRHKKKMKTVLIIFKDWLQKLGAINFFQAFFCTYFQIRAAFSHDEKDNEKFGKYIKKMWRIAIRTCKNENKLPIFF